MGLRRQKKGEYTTARRKLKFCQVSQNSELAYCSDGLGEISKINDNPRHLIVTDNNLDNNIAIYSIPIDSKVKHLIEISVFSVD